MNLYVVIFAILRMNFPKAYKNISDNSQSQKDKKIYLNRSMFFERLLDGKLSLKQALLFYFSKFMEIIEKIKKNSKKAKILSN